VFDGHVVGAVNAVNAVDVVGVVGVVDVVEVGSVFVGFGVEGSSPFPPAALKPSPAP
jgi:hypothetical protein